MENMKDEYVAEVRNGRLVMDEPTDLPDGTKVGLRVTDLDALERAKRDAFLRDSNAAGDRGEERDARDVIARIRSK